MTLFRGSVTRYLAFASLLLLMGVLGFGVALLLNPRKSSAPKPQASTIPAPWLLPQVAVSAKAAALASQLEEEYCGRELMDGAGSWYRITPFSRLVGARWDDNGGQYHKETLALDGNAILLIGIMIPLDLEDGTLSRFLLVAGAGASQTRLKPTLDQMVLVDLGGRRVPFQNQEPVAVGGNLCVGAFRDLQDRPGLYHLATARIYQSADLITYTGS